MSVVENLIESVRSVFERTEDHQDTLSISECAHGTLSPRWNSVEDMGREDLIARYECTSCGTVVEPERAEEIQSERIRRLRQVG